jgi:peptidoglycan/xylan/chitin deacetylase (PgdA/CDA1 family)
VASARLLCERHAVARKPHKGEPRSRILCYHSVGTPSWGVNDVSPARFRRQLELVLERGYRFVPASKLASGVAEGTELAVTFDDGLTSVATNAAPILAELNIPWSLFVVSDWAEGRHSFGDGVMLGWREIERLAGAGVEIGSHSVTHPDFGGLDPQAAVEELQVSRDVIGARLGAAPQSFAIPFGQSANWTQAAQQSALAAGYTTIYAQTERPRVAGQASRTFVTRFDGDGIFRALLGGAFDGWEEWF